MSDRPEPTGAEVDHLAAVISDAHVAGIVHNNRVLARRILDAGYGRGTLAAVRILREIHAEIASRNGYGEIADLLDARADELKEEVS